MGRLHRARHRAQRCECDEGDFDVDNAFFLGCPADNGLFGADGVLHTGDAPRTVIIDCADVVQGPQEGDETTIRVFGTRREVE